MVHVAGTNGKGSVVAMLTAIQRAGGRSTNAYVSPHLQRFNERILIDGKPIDDAALEAALDEAERVNAGDPITFFEITTAAAYLAFRAQPAEVTVLETGLGGRLDATNVVEHPALTVITPVGLDHCERLGSTLPAIAAEKAGILKEGVPVVVGRQAPAAMRVIAERAAQLRAPLHRCGSEWTVERDEGRAFFCDGTGLRLRLPAGLVGRHQVDNAGIAVACTAAVAEFGVPEACMTRAIERMRWPGRLERLRSGPLAALAAPSEFWVDAGHNPDAARALAAWAREGPPLHLVTGLAANKDAGQFFAAFCGVAESAATVPLGPDTKAWSPEALAEAATRAGLPARPHRSLEDAVRSSGRARPGRILVAGSFVLAGQAYHRTGRAVGGISL